MYLKPFKSDLIPDTTTFGTIIVLNVKTRDSFKSVSLQVSIRVKARTTVSVTRFNGVLALKDNVPVSES